MSGHTLLVKGGRMLDPAGELHRPPLMDILVEGGTIVATGAEATASGEARGACVLDASGLLITPGFVNTHSHSHDTMLRGLFEQQPLELWGSVAFPFHWPRKSLHELELRTSLHAAECLRSGITTVVDMVTLVDWLPEEAQVVADAYSASGIRAIIAPQYSDLSGAAGVAFVEDHFTGDLRQALGADDDTLRVQRAVLQLLDGVHAADVTMALGPVQPQICSDELLAWTARVATERGLRTMTHLYETRSEAVLARTTLGADEGSSVKRLARLGLLDHHLTIAHGVWISPSEIDQLASAGTSLACNPVTNLKLLNGVAPMHRYVKAGAAVGLGGDNTSASDAQSMFQAMKLYALAWGLQAAGGSASAPGDSKARARVNAGSQDAAAQAFRAATIGGATALGLNTEIGRIATGYRADLAFFDLGDPAWRPLNSAVRQLVYGESGRGLKKVMVNGRLVVDHGTCTRLDEPLLADQAEAWRAASAEDLAAVIRSATRVSHAWQAVLARCESWPLSIDALQLARRT